MSKTLFINALIACVDGNTGYGLRNDSALLVEGSEIVWLGSMDDCPSFDTAVIVDCKNRLLTPGLIDCHTHIVYGGDRADEFEWRLEGISYQDIARRGGGINSTVNATRETSEIELLNQSAKRVRSLLNEGVTTLEIKSGYGLDVDNEIKMLRVARRLGNSLDVGVQTTFLGAHALPNEYLGDADKYIEKVCNQMLPAACEAGLVDAVDVFIETIAFSCEQGRKVLECARQLNLPIKAHAEQLSDQGGAAMSAALGAMSVDHLEYLREEDVALLANNSTVAVLLPGAFYTLKESQQPPIEALRKNNVAMAIATDANPGSSPVHSILSCMNMACTLFGLTPSEALRGVTINAAKALGLESKVGSLEIGKQADIVLWDVEKPSMLSYRLGINPMLKTMRAGQWRHHEAHI